MLFRSELEGLINFQSEPWKLAPLMILIVVVTCFQVLMPREEVSA